MSAFLGVERSFNGRRWVLRDADPRLALTFSQRLRLPEIIGRVMAGRGISLEGAETYLNPSLRTDLPDPSRFKDMDIAAERLASAVMSGELVAVFGDYDVDGATSSALLKRFVESVGGRARVYIPDRMTEGYGPNTPALRKLKEEGASVVVTVDCGTTAFDALEDAAQQGLDVIVADHHEAEPKLPKALAVVNPNRIDESGAFHHLAAVGVVFLLIVAINRQLRQAGWFGQGRAEPDLMGWLDLVALGTVCDVVPLQGLNRAFVTQGLKVMGRRTNLGLAALADIAKLSEKPGAWHAGYLLGPRINAGGRVGASDLGTRLLSTEDSFEAAELAQKLDALNKQRQEIEAAVLLDAIEQVESTASEDTPLLFASGKNWHPGVIGIVAGRLKERYARPACAISIENGVGKGSGRSVNGVDLGAAIIAARQAGLLINGGGHAMAAGFTVAEERLAELELFLGERLRLQSDAGLAPVLVFDGAVEPGGATYDLVETLERCGPYGAGNDEPRFALAGVRIAKADIVGTGHVRCNLAGPGGGWLKAIAFKSVDSELGHALLSSKGEPLHIAGSLRADTWQGRRSAQLVIEDAARIS
ncbi:MAG: single-stranded-DNA-specific exonuclease RecJ [Alphaproteobacteria bacterium]|nr:single-stranded-DNA-specific exonuclease RecJ [Alphaproteobacteria bacterium]